MNLFTLIFTLLFSGGLWAAEGEDAPSKPSSRFQDEFLVYRCSAFAMTELFGPTQRTNDTESFAFYELGPGGHSAEFSIFYQVGESFALLKADFSYEDLKGQKKMSTLGPLIGRILSDYLITQMQTSAALRAFAVERGLDINQATLRSTYAPMVNVLYSPMGDPAQVANSLTPYFATQLKIFVPMADMQSAYVNAFQITAEISHLETQGSAGAGVTAAWNKLYRAQCLTEGLHEGSYRNMLAFADLQSLDSHGASVHRQIIDQTLIGFSAANGLPSPTDLLSEEDFWSGLSARWNRLNENEKERVFAGALTLSLAGAGGMAAMLDGSAEQLVRLAARRILALAGPIGMLAAMTGPANADETLEGQMSFKNVDRLLRNSDQVQSMRHTFAQWNELQHFYYELAAALPKPD